MRVDSKEHVFIPKSVFRVKKATVESLEHQDPLETKESQVKMVPREQWETLDMG